MKESKKFTKKFLQDYVAEISLKLPAMELLVFFHVFHMKLSIEETALVLNISVAEVLELNEKSKEHLRHGLAKIGIEKEIVK